MPLTNIAIRRAQPGNKSRKMFDGGGLYLEIAPKGGKWWRLKYRFSGKEKRLALGVYPSVSLKQARRRREEARQLLAQQIDPSELRKAEKASREGHSGNSFETVAREWFAKQSPNWAAGHASRVLRRLEKDIFPWIGSKPIATITAPQLLVAIRRIEERGALESAHRALQKCGQVFRYAVATGRAERDLTADLRGALPHVKETHLAALTDPKQVGPLLSSGQLQRVIDRGMRLAAGPTGIRSAR